MQICYYTTGWPLSNLYKNEVTFSRWQQKLNVVHFLPYQNETDTVNVHCRQTSCWVMTDQGIYVVLQCVTNLFTTISVPPVEEHCRCSDLLGPLRSLSFVYPYKNPHFAEFPDGSLCTYNALDFGKSLDPSGVTFMFMCCVTLPAYVVSCRLPRILLRSNLSALFKDPANS
jgi:hypothetical protein